MPQSQPNLLILIVDQLTGTLFPDGPAAFLHTPNLRALAERSVRFCNAYAPSPLCWPSRASLMSGQLPSKTGVYDNAALFPADVPTFAHYLRRAGYQTSLSGKMHFVGPDQLHGYEARLRQPGRADRLVVPQHGLGRWGRRRRDHQPARIR
jgi:choline-sulfatase